MVVNKTGVQRAGPLQCLYQGAIDPLSRRERARVREKSIDRDVSTQPFESLRALSFA